MVNPFGTEEMAAGYATSRPPVHPRVIELVYRELGRTEPFQLALDVGCGAGVSTKALIGFATSCVGLEPNESMLKWASMVALSAGYVVGAAEAIPLRDHSVDLMAAAGSLNYANLDLFFPEAARVLRPDGVLVVYDFSPGRSFRDAAGLDEWFARFYNRYPPAPYEAQELNPAILAEIGSRSGFRVNCQQEFVIGITLSRSFYVDYMMTETNVAAAVRSGVPVEEIRAWCAETLASMWSGADRANREVLFRGYWVCMTVA